MRRRLTHRGVYTVFASRVCGVGLFCILLSGVHIAQAASVGQVLVSYPQQPDTALIYGERRDSLGGSVISASRESSYIFKGSDIRTEVISSTGLTRLACCTLADSFENSAGVTVGYSDATTGARQIKLLGLGGNYTQMLEETRPIMRGLSSPFGLTFIPSAWMESIQIAKGAPTVRNGAESMSGSINIEKRKPTDEKPLYLNASVMSDSRVDLNAVSSLQLSESLSTAIFAHADANFRQMDMNSDGFVDQPISHQFNLANRWFKLYNDGTAFQWGTSALYDKRQGGDIDKSRSDAWNSDIVSKEADAFLKLGHPTGENGSIALIADYSYARLDAGFGSGYYDATQRSLYFNFVRENKLSETHKYVYGVSATSDFYNESIDHGIIDRYRADSYLSDNVLGVYGEYSYTPEERFSLTLGLREDWHIDEAEKRFKTIPRLSLRYAPVSDITLRLNAGRGLRSALPIADNIGIMSTNKRFNGDLIEHLLEDSSIAGANLTWNIAGRSSNYFSIEYFHTEFDEKLIVDMNDASSVSLLALSSIDGGRSYTDNIQADLSMEPLRRLNIGLTFRYTNAMESNTAGELCAKAMTPSFKTVATARYALPLEKWIFDATFSLNGPARVWDFMKTLENDDGNLLYPNGQTPVYPLVYLQITKRMKGWDAYIGCENLTNFTQKNVLLGSRDGLDFDASQVWAPLMGRRIYAGIRITIWKTIR